MMVQINYVDFADPGISSKGVFFKDFRHGDNRLLQECWYDGDHFIVVTNDGDEVIVNKTEARGWTTLLPISWRKGDHLKSLKEQQELVRARTVRDKGK